MQGNQRKRQGKMRRKASQKAAVLGHAWDILSWIHSLAICLGCKERSHREGAGTGTGTGPGLLPPEAYIPCFQATRRRQCWLLATSIFLQILQQSDQASAHIVDCIIMYVFLFFHFAFSSFQLKKGRPGRKGISVVWSWLRHSIATCSYSVGLSKDTYQGTPSLRDSIVCVVNLRNASTYS